MDSQKSKTRRRTRRGVSLIEVLVVLVILVVGILTIIRLFPSGFFSIQSTGNAALADSIGHSGLDQSTQNAAGLPEAILPNNLNQTGGQQDDLVYAALNAAAYSNYDPDNPNNLDNARVISNETVTVPTPTRGRSLYAVQFGPLALGTAAAPLNPTDPAANPTQLGAFMTVNSLPWAAQADNSVASPNIKDLLPLTRPGFLVDTANGQIALPYADYTRNFVLTVVDANSVTHTLYLTVPKQHAVDPTVGSNYLYGPITNNKLDYQISEHDDYNGRWFDPEDANLAYVSAQKPTGNTTLPTPWQFVSLHRPYNWLITGSAFSADPYEFQLASGNIGTSHLNPGAVAFNPLAGGATGFPVLKAQISYITASWGILREDHDIPSLTGTGSTFVVRTTVPNLKKAGAANPDNTIYPGLVAGSNASLVILDLDTGRIAAPGADPTLLNDEDLNGTTATPPTINVSYSLGRITFGSDAFGDNSSATPADGTGTAPAHRIRIFYAADLDWTVAVQKPAAYLSQVSALSNPPETTPLGANQFVYDPSVPCVYVARCNAGKTFEVDGTATPSGGGTPQAFTQTVAAGQVLVSLGAPDVQIPLPSTATAGSAVTFSAVRGLSARAVVAWKERNQYKVHSVDTILSRTP